MQLKSRMMPAARAILAPPAAVRVYYDFETTDFLPRGRVVQFGALAEDGRSFNQLVNPGVAIPQRSSAVHRIHDADVQDAPTFAEAWPRFLAFLDAVAAGEPTLLVGWRSWSFDDKMLHLELSRCGLDPSAIGERDVWTADGLRALEAAVRCKAYACESKKLGDTYATVVGKPLEGAHDALADCTAVRAVLPRFAPYLECCPFSEIGLAVDARTKRPAPPSLQRTESEASKAPDVEPACDTVHLEVVEALKAASEPPRKRRRTTMPCSCGRLYSRFFDCACLLWRSPH